MFYFLKYLKKCLLDVGKKYYTFCVNLCAGLRNSSVEMIHIVYCVDVWCFTVAVSGIIEIRLLVGCLQLYLRETSGNEHNRFELCWYDIVGPNSQVHNIHRIGINNNKL